MTRELEEGALVAAARGGDAAAFASLYHLHKVDVWNLAYFNLRNHHEAEDTVQETFLKAFGSIGGVRRGDRLRPWLLTICRNGCMDRLRAARRAAFVPLDADAVIEHLTHDEDRERAMDLHRALAELPHEDVEAFFLVDVMGCRSEEAARIVGLRASSTLRSRLGRARRHIAAALADPPPPEGDAVVPVLDPFEWTHPV